MANNGRSSETRFRGKVFRATVNEFAAASSAHGVAYILEPGRLGIERGFWIFIVAFMMIFRYSS